jgi:hypothetical protein
VPVVDNRRGGEDGARSFATTARKFFSYSSIGT